VWGGVEGWGVKGERCTTSNKGESARRQRKGEINYRVWWKNGVVKTADKTKNRVPWEGKGTVFRKTRGLSDHGVP